MIKLLLAAMLIGSILNAREYTVDYSKDFASNDNTSIIAYYKGESVIMFGSLAYCKSTTGRLVRGTLADKTDAGFIINVGGNKNYVCKRVFGFQQFNRRLQSGAEI